MLYATMTADECTAQNATMAIDKQNAKALKISTKCLKAVETLRDDIQELNPDNEIMSVIYMLHGQLLHAVNTFESRVAPAPVVRKTRRRRTPKADVAVADPATPVKKVTRKRGRPAKSTTPPDAA